MSSDTGVSELLLRWRELRQQGHHPSAGEAGAEVLTAALALVRDGASEFADQAA